MWVFRFPLNQSFERVLRNPNGTCRLEQDLPLARGYLIWGVSLGYRPSGSIRLCTENESKNIARREAYPTKTMFSLDAGKAFRSLRSVKGALSRILNALGLRRFAQACSKLALDWERENRLPIFPLPA
jgi:hypothetical protein